ncbi:MAG: hypothetical protein L0H41_17130 [Microlunatus sp.]|nr:hypothetical protein [Microlunatus sp.]MDN5771188.1 hypothetical protein [Microlunatus sp.]
MTVHAHLRQASTGLRDAPEPERRHVQVDADTYEVARDRILADLPEGWIVASWRVER